MEVTRAGGAAVPLHGGGAPVEEVRQGRRLRHRRRMGRVLSKARGPWSTRGSSASSRRWRWLNVGALHLGDDGVVAHDDPHEVLWLEEEERELRHRSNRVENGGEQRSP
jgi:hypothetical protein